MKKTLAATVLLALGAATAVSLAQPPGGGPRDRGPGQFGPPPPPPLLEALDADHDRTISADEMANASEALKSLDKNDDGKLTEEELMPPRPERGDRGPRGDGPREGKRGRREGAEGLGRGPGRGPGGPGHAGPPPGAGGPPMMPPHVREALGLSEDQQSQLETLHKETREKFEKILTPEQLEKLKELGPPGPPRR